MSDCPAGLSELAPSQKPSMGTILKAPDESN